MRHVAKRIASVLSRTILTAAAWIVCGTTPGSQADVGEAAWLTPAECRWRAEGYAQEGDFAAAVRFFREGCDRGDDESCIQLAWRHKRGIGVARDHLEAARAFGKVAWSRDPAAEANFERLLRYRPDVVRRMREACDGGNGEDCRALVLFLVEHELGGEEAVRRLVQAYRLGRCDNWDRYGIGKSSFVEPLLWQGCEDGHAACCNSLGDLHLLRAAPERPTTAARLFRRACDGGDARGCLSLGSIYLFEHDPDQALGPLMRACDGGQSDGCWLVAARALLSSDLAIEGLAGVVEAALASSTSAVASVVHRLRQVCRDSRNTGACGYAGMLYELGKGVERDYGEAARWYRRDCYAGNAESCARLGSSRHVELDGDPYDYEQRRRLCEQGHAFSCRRVVADFVVSLYRRHRPVGAARRLHEACEGGNAHACGYLGILRWREQGAAPEAARLLRQACDGGDFYGCRFLGFLVETGKGVARDDVEADRLYRLGCKVASFGCGDHGARRYMDESAWEHHVATAYRVAEPAVGGAGGDAKRLLRDACDEGDAYACRYLAVGYERGFGRGEGDAAEAVRLYRRSCDGGNALACRILAYKLELKSDVEAARRFRQVCDAGFAETCARLGRDYALGDRKVARDYESAATLLRQACEAGELSGCHHLANLYAHGYGVAKDDVEATRLFRVACESGYDESCWDLGDRYATGRGTTRDLVEAARLFRLPCEHGWGCNRLAVRYETGQGVAKDDAEAVRLYRLACEGEEGYGCANLGLRYETGRGVAQDKVKAIRLYRLACEGRSRFACSRLGDLYATDQGLPREDAQGFHYFRQACDLGSPYGCQQVGNRYATGRVVARNYVEAGRHFIKSMRLWWSDWLDRRRLQVDGVIDGLRSFLAGD